MKKLHLSILWHQHQPYYKDDSDGIYHMPWVFLHAIKDYYEMARHVEMAENMKVVFNYVPSLLIQLEDYADVNVKDTFLMLIRKPVNSLSKDEKVTVANQCFMANLENMIRPLKRFSELYDKQVLNRGDLSIFSNDEILDIEVLYLLSWTGEFIRREEPFIANLLKKGKNFTEDEKLQFHHHLAFWVSQVKVVHNRLKVSGKVELSTTPFYHPILPLLADIQSAKETFHNISMPSITANTDVDADWHLVEGLKEFERQFGFKPVGMWPAEGSVSQRTAVKYAENGVKWIATDEDVLANSLKLNLKDSKNRHLLYIKRFQVHNNQRISIFFRDKTLSDLIGFTYATWKAEDAVNDFIKHLKMIYDSVNFSPHVSVILDGENAWEYYKGNAFEFFTLLYKKLSNIDWLQSETFGESIANHDVPEEILSNIVAGSWIMGNFKIWIGHSEKNKAWEMIALTRKAISQHIDKADESIKTQIYKELHIAEGSDWFWWFGDDHFSVQSELFDKLFRTHLVNIYKLLKLNVPSELYTPIKLVSHSGLVKRPTYYVSPHIDGSLTSFYEWLSAGEFDLKADSGAMHAGGDVLKKLSYGFDLKNIYLRFNTDLSDSFCDTFEIEAISGDIREVYDIPILLKNTLTSTDRYKAYVGKVLEISIPLKHFAKAEKLYLIFKLKKDNVVYEKAPLYNAIEIDINETFKNDWIV